MPVYGFAIMIANDKQMIQTIRPAKYGKPFFFVESVLFGKLLLADLLHNNGSSWLLVTGYISKITLIVL